MKSYLLAHASWKKMVAPGDTVIDATLGNGHDTLLIARLLKGEGRVIGYDIQKNSIEKSRQLLESQLATHELQTVTLLHASHEEFQDLPAKLIIYNLGYLPFGDKAVTTTAPTTIKSLTSACKILLPGGAISLMAYVGHPAGKEEYTEIKKFFYNLPKEEFLVLENSFLNREKAPHFFLCIKREGGEFPFPYCM